MGGTVTNRRGVVLLVSGQGTHSPAPPHSIRTQCRHDQTTTTTNAPDRHECVEYAGQVGLVVAALCANIGARGMRCNCDHALHFSLPRCTPPPPPTPPPRCILRRRGAGVAKHAPLPAHRNIQKGEAGSGHCHVMGLPTSCDRKVMATIKTFAVMPSVTTFDSASTGDYSIGRLLFLFTRGSTGGLPAGGAIPCK